MSETPGTGQAAEEVAINPARALWAERTAVREYTGRNSRGAEVLVGEGPGRFTPGELLQLALATCAGLSADHRLSHVLGKDFAATTGVSAEKIAQENRYGALTVEIVTDLSAVEGEDRERMIERAEAAIERNCTVGRTLTASATHTTIFADEPAG